MTNKSANNQHPEGRLCRIVNVAGGTLLDQTVGKNSNFVIASPAAGTTIKHWIIVQNGPGYALRTAEDMIPRYLAPTSGGPTDGQSVTLSTFPCYWDLCQIGEDTNSRDPIPADVIEEWTCIIKWPYNTTVLDLEDHGRGTRVHFRPHRTPRNLCQFWKIQVVSDAPVQSTYPPTYQSPIASNNLQSGLENGATYVLYNVKSKTVIDQNFGRDNKTVHSHQFAGGQQQQWKAINKQDGWVFKNIKNGHYLSLEQDPANGVRVRTRESDPALWTVQRHKFERDQGENVYRLILRGSEYALSLSNYGHWENGTHIVLWQSWDCSHQTWKFEKVE